VESFLSYICNWFNRLPIRNSGYRLTSRRACFGVWVEDITIFAAESEVEVEVEVDIDVNVDVDAVE